uniref:acetyl-CoA carboxylase biotin carboxyl carrier protein subunit n=1 Tax=Nocardia abscessus TaxID=120957 RepID=UPI0024577388
GSRQPLGLRGVVDTRGRRPVGSRPARPPAPAAPAAPRRIGRGARGGGAGRRPAEADALVAPMQGTVVKIAVAEGDRVEAGDLVAVLEAMKMEQPLTAHRAGVVRELTATVGATVHTGATLCRLDDSGSYAA